MAAAKNASNQNTKNGRDVQRLSFGKVPEALEVPNLVSIQTESFGWLIGSEDWRSREAARLGVDPKSLKSGLEEVFEDVSPIQDNQGDMQLSFANPILEEPKYTIEESKDRSKTYSAPFYVEAEFMNNKTGEIKTQTIYMGDLQLMTDKGTFVINGSERVVVSQLTRSPGVYFERSIDPGTMKELYSARVIPNRGAWLEFEVDKNDRVSVRIDRKRRQSATIFLKALGLSTEDIRREFKGFQTIENTLERENIESQEAALRDIYSKIRVGEQISTESANNLLRGYYLEPNRYDLARVGRYKINQKLGLELPLETSVLTTEDIVATIRYMVSLQEKGSESAPVRKVEGKKDTYAIDGKRDGKKVDIRLTTDDIDHFGNRRIRTVGELIQAQLRVGLTRIEKTVRERMSSQQVDTITPSTLMNTRPVTAALKDFFGSSQLSQFMDQHNPLAGLTHKRRLSALGPGGLSRERAGVDVRDVHSSHYGRMCPIETPEGQNIGLIGSLATYARINSFGFLETPYQKVENGKVTDKIEYLSAHEEDEYKIAQANEPIGKDRKFTSERVLARVAGEEVESVPAAEVDYVDVSPRQMVSVATSMIPFLEHDDANRALMGANMQRQAVPLVRSESPMVGTGVERYGAIDSGDVIIAEKAGVVQEVSADQVIVQLDEGGTQTHRLRKFERSNHGNSYNHKVLVSAGERIEVGQIIADGPATQNGEFALGKNLLVAFMPWEGHNFEDAIIISQELVKDDTLSSVHIEAYDIEARDTKLGKEEITRSLPHLSQDHQLKDLDERGIVRIGAEVRTGDILVGKVTPKGETELTPEDRLLRAIFGAKSKEVRDTSLRMPHGSEGTVIAVKVFDVEEGDELANSVNQRVVVYVAQKRKITEGDKLAGRHGNKGVIAKILPVEDMPFLEDGTPVDIILTPLGVPGRMNFGQVLETHLGWATKQGWKIEGNPEWAANLPKEAWDVAPDARVATPVFDSASEEEIRGLLASTLPNRDGKRMVNTDGKATLFDGRTGEPYPDPIAVGYMYILKLHHLVDDKIHARSTGPYSMITQQPLGGKAQFGGQRFGEMEVWALEAYGAAHALQELLTIKSDDEIGRQKAYKAIINGQNFEEPSIPQSFKVLVKELQALALNVEYISAEGDVVNLQGADQIEREKSRLRREMGGINTASTNEMPDADEE